MLKSDREVTFFFLYIPLMKHLKTYHQHNESIKSNIAKLGLIGSLMLPGTADSKQLPNSINKEWIAEHPKDGMEVVKQVSELSNLRLKQKQKDPELAQVLDEIQENLSSRDSAKFVELYNRLSKIAQEKYNVKIESDIEQLQASGTNPKDLNLIQILGWLGSICLAVCAIPQAWMSYKEKHSEGISFAYLLLWAFGEVFALAYVYDKLDLPLLLNYATNILVLGIIIYYKIKPGNQETLSE